MVIFNDFDILDLIYRFQAVEPYDWTIISVMTIIIYHNLETIINYIYLLLIGCDILDHKWIIIINLLVQIYVSIKYNNKWKQ